MTASRNAATRLTPRSAPTAAPRKSGSTTTKGSFRRVGAAEEWASGGVTVEGLSDPGYFSDMSGKKQIFVGTLSGSKLAWMAAYHARFPSLEIKSWIAPRRPLKNRRVGGNATMLYSRPCRQSPDSYG